MITAINNLIEKNYYSSELIKAVRQYHDDMIESVSSKGLNHTSKLRDLTKNPKKNIFSHLNSNKSRIVSILEKLSLVTKKILCFSSVGLRMPRSSFRFKYARNAAIYAFLTSDSDRKVNSYRLELDSFISKLRAETKALVRAELEKKDKEEIEKRSKRAKEKIEKENNFRLDMEFNETKKNTDCTILEIESRKNTQIESTKKSEEDKLKKPRRINDALMSAALSGNIKKLKEEMGKIRKRAYTATFKRHNPAEGLIGNIFIVL